MILHYITDNMGSTALQLAKHNSIASPFLIHNLILVQIPWPEEELKLKRVEINC